MAVQVNIELVGEKVVSRMLVGMTNAITDFRPAWEEIAKSFAANERELFATKGFGSWPELSPKYAAWKAKKYGNMPIMRRSDKMYKSLTERPFGVEVMKPLSMRIGTAIEYSRYHQFGGWRRHKSGAGWPPQRKVIIVPEQTRNEWVKIVQRHVVVSTRKKYGTPAWAPPEGTDPKA